MAKMRRTIILAVVVAVLTQSCIDGGGSDYSTAPSRDTVGTMLSGATADSASTHWGGTAGVLALYGDDTGHQSEGGPGGGLVLFKWVQIDDDTILVEFNWANSVRWRVLRVLGGSLDEGWLSLQEIGGDTEIPFVLVSGAL